MPIWGYLRSVQTPILPSSAQSVALNYSCYCGVRIELAIGSLPYSQAIPPAWKSEASLECRQSGKHGALHVWLQTRLQISLGLEVISLRDDPSLEKSRAQKNKTKQIYPLGKLNWWLDMGSHVFFSIQWVRAIVTILSSFLTLIRNFQVTAFTK